MAKATVKTDKQAEKQRQRELQRRADLGRQRTDTRRRRFRLGGGAAAVLLLIGAVAVALHGYGSTTPTSAAAASLGAPTDATPPTPTGQFHKAGAVLRQGGKAEFVFFGALYCPHCAVERWAIVKSLSQFGRFAHMTSTTNGQGVPTFDLTHATYQSKYLSFVARDMQDQGGNQLQALSADQQALFSQYDPSGGIPLVAVGGYAMSGSPILPDEISGRQFDSVQSALKHNAGDTFVQDINAEANVLTALICHADGMHPQAACSRPAIRQIMASVR